MSNKSVDNIKRNYYLKLDIGSRVDEFNKKLTERLDDENFQGNSDVDDKFDFILIDEDIRNNLVVNYSRGITPTDEEYYDMIVKGRPNYEDEVIDKYLNMNFIFDVRINNNFRGTVVKRSRGLDGRAICHLRTNPFFDTREYDIEFTDRMQYKYGAKPIGESMYAQVDEAGHQFWLLAEIQYHQKDGTAISNEEGNIRSANGM